MNPYITATYEPDAGRVRLDVTDMAGDNPVILFCDNGVFWCILTTGPVDGVLYDYEAPLNQVRTYKILGKDLSFAKVVPVQPEHWLKQP